MLYPLVHYAQYLTAEQLNATDAFFGYLLELAIKDFFGKPLVISAAGKVDMSVIIDGHLRRVEIKQNGGDFRVNGKGNSFIFYSVFVDVNKPLNAQFGYLMPMSTFRECGYKLNHIRKEKTDVHGAVKMSLQTLYNYTKADYHGAKAFKLAALYEENGAVSFKDFFVK